MTARRPDGVRIVDARRTVEWKVRAAQSRAARLTGMSTGRSGRASGCISPPCWRGEPSEWRTGMLDPEPASFVSFGGNRRIGPRD